VKVHKPTVSVRLLVANTAWITSPIPVWLAAILQPLIDDFDTVASSSEDVVLGLNKLGSAELEGAKVNSYDVEKLYPSIDQERCSATIHASVVRHFEAHPVPKWGALVELIDAFVLIVFTAQFAIWCSRGIQRRFRQVKGISTGLACGSQFANIFLQALDHSISATFGADIALYQRYIDDILVIGTMSLSALLMHMNAFDDGIVITHDNKELGLATSFLDLYITLNRHDVMYETYRKPLCTYDYLPFASCHSESTRLGIFKGELVRLLRTNKIRSGFDREAEFAFRKLIDRGYCRVALRKIRSQITWDSKKDFSEPKKANKDMRVFLFKIRYSDAVRKIGIGGIIASQMSGLPRDFFSSLPHCFMPRFE
jgi:hypothetical protein